jgi:hypothetical protein
MPYKTLLPYFLLSIIFEPPAAIVENDQMKVASCYGIDRKIDVSFVFVTVIRDI